MFRGFSFKKLIADEPIELSRRLLYLILLCHWGVRAQKACHCILSMPESRLVPGILYFTSVKVAVFGQSCHSFLCSCLRFKQQRKAFFRPKFPPIWHVRLNGEGGQQYLRREQRTYHTRPHFKMSTILTRWWKILRRRRLREIGHQHGTAVMSQQRKGLTCQCNISLFTITFSTELLRVRLTCSWKFRSK